ncbi:TonB-dependent receptor [Flavobacterium sp. I3-2]|uniref:TonB-dependent receptor n=1 Tax=Flavobacterium sp. I3-2 TaxID=2748319 RepID=UPI00210725D7|nr:TonB-dependent receptor [Flavobacterium sp. I3-2]
MMRISILIICLIHSVIVFSQNTLKGKVVDANGMPLNKCHIDWNAYCATTNSDGTFELQNIPSGSFNLRVKLDGFQTQDVFVNVPETTFVEVVLFTEDEMLDELVISTNQPKTYNGISVKSNQIKDNFAGSLAKSLENVAGVTAMEIGSGVSKPMIRGLGFTRIAVTENGIKQEGQQWGADHGLEIDALQAEEVEVIKGVGAIAYGSDAIGGVIRINNEKIPQENTTSGNVIFHGKTVNDALGASVNFQHRNENWFFKAKFSGVDYADFKVPTSEVNYLNTKIPIYNNRMKNTAGDEYSVYLQGGYVSDSFQSILSVSNLKSKIGFFAGAHGIPSVGAVADDGNYRDVGFPYQTVNHFKVTSSNKWKKPHSEWNAIFSFQQNHRQEWSLFHSHYSNQTAPSVNPNLELDFVLNTLDSQVNYSFETGLNHETTFGFQQNYQQNNVSGYSYLLPEYNRNNLAFYANHQWFVSSKTTLDFGARLDYIDMKTQGYFDSILYDYLVSNGKTETVAKENAQRSSDVHKTYLQTNFAFGLSYVMHPKWKWNFNVGTNFRAPTAMELSANGIHHGAFRHEKGNPNLKVERGVSSEIGLTFENGNFKSTLSPYVYYFSNYIFLKPTGTFSVLPHGGQVYEYSQSKALITGFEYALQQKWNSFTLNATFEYLYNKQLDNPKGNYPLPFSTPINLSAELSYAFKDSKITKQSKVYINTKWASAQNRIAQNEEKTPGYTIFGAGLQSEINIGKLKPVVRLQGNNLLNTKYYNHASFYRAIEIPELGRNVQLMIQIPF